MIRNMDYHKLNTTEFLGCSCRTKRCSWAGTLVNSRNKLTMGQEKAGRTVSMSHEESGGRPHPFLGCSLVGLLLLLLLLLRFILVFYFISL